MKAKRKYLILGFTFLLIGLVTTPIIILNSTEAGRVEPKTEALKQFRIIYLSADRLDANNQANLTQSLEHSIASKTVNSWKELSEISKEGAIDALIIAKPAMSKVNKKQLTRWYRKGLVVGGINMTGADLASLVNDHCISDDGFGVAYKGNYFTLASHIVLGTDEDVALIRMANNCGKAEVKGVKGVTGEGVNRSNDKLNDVNDFSIFSNALFSQLQTINTQRAEYAQTK